MMGEFNFFDLATGVFSGRVFVGPESEASIECPDGFGMFSGAVDIDRVRVDIATGEIVPYQPPAPADDEWLEWSWDADAWRWVSAPTAAALARDARAERARRLLACDWTQLPDVPTWTAQAWATYRQALRDITEQVGFPAAITWPEEPTP